MKGSCHWSIWTSSPLIDDVVKISIDFYNFSSHFKKSGESLREPSVLENGAVQGARNHFLALHIHSIDLMLQKHLTCQKNQQ